MYPGAGSPGLGHKWQEQGFIHRLVLTVALVSDLETRKQGSGLRQWLPGAVILVLVVILAVVLVLVMVTVMMMEWAVAMVW